VRVGRRQARGEAQAFVFIQCAQREGSPQDRTAQRQRAGRVEDHVGGALQRFEHVRFDRQHATPQQAVGDGGQRGWRGQRQRARTGHHQHRDRGQRPRQQRKELFMAQHAERARLPQGAV
jgi:hypothetical protein